MKCLFFQLSCYCQINIFQYTKIIFEEKININSVLQTISDNDLQSIFYTDNELKL